MAAPDIVKYRPLGSRLKAVQVDRLDSVGLPSKGDRRLLDHQIQEQYYANILDRYTTYNRSTTTNSNIEEAFASLSLDGVQSVGDGRKDSVQKQSSTWFTQASNRDSEELARILMAMRRMREAIVASKRSDDFAIKVYIFIIRATISEKHMESYHPALLHLLNKLHATKPLTEAEHHEFLGYYVLDLACRQNDLMAAYRVRYHQRYADEKIDAILRALMHGNWCVYWDIRKQADVYQQRLMSWADDSVRKHAIGCVGKSYISMDKQGLEKAINRRWEDFVGRSDLSWQLEEDVITIRRIKAK